MRAIWRKAVAQVLAGILALWSLIAFARAVVGVGRDIDFLVSRYHDPAWLAAVLQLIAAPPLWLVIGGFLLAMLTLWLANSQSLATLLGASSADHSFKVTESSPKNALIENERNASIQNCVFDFEEVSAFSGTAIHNEGQLDRNVVSVRRAKS